MKTVLFVILLALSFSSHALNVVEPAPEQDTDVVLLQATTPLGLTQISQAVSFIELTLGVSLVEESTRSTAFRYRADRFITVAEQSLLRLNFPSIDVAINFPIENYQVRPGNGNGGGSSLLKTK